MLGKVIKQAKTVAESLDNEIIFINNSPSAVVAGALAHSFVNRYKDMPVVVGRESADFLESVERFFEFPDDDVTTRMVEYTDLIDISLDKSLALFHGEVRPKIVEFLETAKEIRARTQVYDSMSKFNLKLLKLPEPLIVNYDLTNASDYAGQSLPSYPKTNKFNVVLPNLSELLMTNDTDMDLTVSALLGRCKKDDPDFLKDVMLLLHDPEYGNGKLASVNLYKKLDIYLIAYLSLLAIADKPEVQQTSLSLEKFEDTVRLLRNYYGIVIAKLLRQHETFNDNRTVIMDVKEKSSGEVEISIIKTNYDEWVAGNGTTEAMIGAILHNPKKKMFSVRELDAKMIEYVDIFKKYEELSLATTQRENTKLNKDVLKRAFYELTLDENGEKVFSDIESKLRERYPEIRPREVVANEIIDDFNLISSVDESLAIRIICNAMYPMTGALEFFTSMNDAKMSGNTPQGTAMLATIDLVAGYIVSQMEVIA